jgi:hypothetical protein
MCGFFLFSDYDDVRKAVNDTVRTYMEKFAEVWEDCGYNDVSIQQRCEAVKQHVQVSTILRLSLKLSSVVFSYQNYLCFCASVHDTQSGQKNITVVTGFLNTIN